jgi:hypothetical protein
MRKDKKLAAIMAYLVPKQGLSIEPTKNPLPIQFARPTDVAEVHTSLGITNDTVSDVGKRLLVTIEEQIRNMDATAERMGDLSNIDEEIKSSIRKELSAMELSYAEAHEKIVKALKAERNRFDTHVHRVAHLEKKTEGLRTENHDTAEAVKVQEKKSKEIENCIKDILEQSCKQIDQAEARLHTFIDTMSTAQQDALFKDIVLLFQNLEKETDAQIRTVSKRVTANEQDIARMGERDIDLKAGKNVTILKEQEESRTTYTISATGTQIRSRVPNPFVSLTDDGIVVRTDPETYTTRTIAGAASNILVSNGTGVSGNPTIDLTDTAVTPGSYGSAGNVARVTVDQKGRLTAATNTSIQIAESQVTNLVTDLDSKLAKTSNLSDINDIAVARTNLGLVAGGAGDIWVEKAGDAMTGPLTITTTNLDTGPLDIVVDQTNGGTSSQFNMTVYTTAQAPGFNFSRALNTLASPQTLTSGQRVFTMQQLGYNGNAVFQAVTQTLYEVDGVSSNTLGGRQRFYTADTTGTLTERMRIDDDGLVQIYSNADVDGTLTVDGIGTFARLGIGSTPGGQEYFRLRNDVNNVTDAIYENQDSGTAAQVRFQLRNGSSALDGLTVGVLGAGFTTNGGFIQDSAYLSAESNIAGISFIARAATGVLGFYTGGFASTNRRLLIDASGISTFSNSVGIDASSGGATFTLTTNAAAGITIESKTTANTNNIIRLRALGTIAGSSATGRVRFIDNDGTADIITGDLTAAHNNALGSRYFGFIAQHDRDGEKYPIRFFTENAAGTSTSSFMIGVDGDQGKIIVGNSTTTLGVLTVYGQAATDTAVFRSSSGATPNVRLLRNDTTVTSGESLGMLEFVTNDATVTTATAQVGGYIDVRANAAFTTDAAQSNMFFGTKSTTTGAAPDDKLALTHDGRLYGLFLHNNAGAVTGTTNQYIASGTYTPTPTHVANVAASTAYACQWIRVGNVVTVSGKVDIDTTLAASTATELGMSLPIASNFTAEQNLGGTAASDSVASLSARIKADATNDRASIVFKSISVTNDSFNFSFTYVVL